MSEPDNFLTRWARRKREVEAAEGKDKLPPAPEDAARNKEDDATPAKAVEGVGTKPPEPAFDLSSLPSIEAITKTTDLSGFLNPAVPESLRRAALRHAWTLDPPSRETLLMAEYAWDFTTETGDVAGFGAMEMTDELRKMARQIVGGMSDRPQESPPEPASADVHDGETPDLAGSDAVHPGGPAAELAVPQIPAAPGVTAAVPRESEVVEQDSDAADDLLHRNKNSDAVQQVADVSDGKPSSVPRARGRALPR